MSRVENKFFSLEAEKGVAFREESTLDTVRSVLAKDKACYVLITCDSPSADGQMRVELTYEGDSALAAYLIESAQERMDY